MWQLERTLIQIPGKVLSGKDIFSRISEWWMNLVLEGKENDKQIFILRNII